MPKFGKAGIKKGKNFTSTDIFLGKGESLLFHITFENGITPIFSIDCRDMNIMSVKASDPPKAKYEFEWGKKPSDIHKPNEDDNYTLSMSFAFAPIKYNYLVKRLDSSGNLIETIKDVSFESTDSSDSTFTGLTIIRKS